jgi:hypothetical protein
VHHPSPAFTVEKFEYVDAAPGLALVRLSGSWRAGDPPGDVGLVAWLGGERIPLSALPAPPSAEGFWRAAYSADPELLADPATAFELEPPEGPPIALRAPVEHGAAEAQPEAEPEQTAAVAPPQPRPDRDTAARPRIFGRRRSGPIPPDVAGLRAALAAEREARQAAERTAAEERARAQQAEAMLAEELRNTVGKTEELIERIGGYEHSRVSFEQELDAVRRTHSDLLAEAREEHALDLHAIREELEAAQRELAVALDDLDAANEHVDTLHEAHSLELGAARSQRDAADERRAGLERLLADERATTESLHTQLDDREEVIERARAEAAQATEQSADLEDAVMDLRDAIAARARDAANARRRFARTPEALDRSRDELRRDAERIAALERQAEALRDAIHSQLPYSLHASPLQEALPLPLPGEEEPVMDTEGER